jgi:type VI secretion system protein ImpB
MWHVECNHWFQRQAQLALMHLTVLVGWGKIGGVIPRSVLMAQKTGKAGSVAPKERVNIVYKTYVGDAQEDVELPFRFLVLGDFTGRPDDTIIEKRPPIGVDKDNFDSVLAAHEVSVKANVPDQLSETPGHELSVDLKFRAMKDFTPDQLCQQVPELKSLVDLRDALAALRGPLGNIPAFRKRLEAVLDDPEGRKRLMEELNLVLDDKAQK